MVLIIQDTFTRRTILPETEAAVSAEPVPVPLSDDLECWTTPERFELFSEIIFIYTEIFEQRCYLRHLRALPEAPVVVDIGANVGLFSLFVARERPAARIWAFEPMPDTLAAAQRRDPQPRRSDGAAGGAWEPDRERRSLQLLFPNSRQLDALPPRQGNRCTVEH
jgi:hypothetical protein